MIYLSPLGTYWNEYCTYGTVLVFKMEELWEGKEHIYCIVGK